LDAGKGALAIYVVYLALRGGHVIFPHELPVASLFAILGHCFPVWLGFKGGKGVATAVGAFAVIAPKAVLVSLICFVLIFAFTRYVSIASIGAAIAFPVASFFFLYSELHSLPIMIAASALIILKHHGNIRRLIAGTEPRFGKQAIGTNDPGETEKSI
ncbi:MAG: glycerol-3-phosphate acyltransferase, partial [Terriglobales bacterium]